MVVLERFHTAYITLSQSELNRYKFQRGDTEGFVNYALSIKNVMFAAIFIEDKKQKIIKISFRSVGEFSVNEFSRNHFNGGGHVNAAGGRSDLSLKETVKKFVDILPSLTNELSLIIMKHILSSSLTLFTVFISCSNPEARKPIVRKTSSFMSESIERNKMLNKAENAIINAENEIR